MINYSEWIAQAEDRLAEIENERVRLLAIVENMRALVNRSDDDGETLVAPSHRALRENTFKFHERSVRVRKPRSSSVMDATREAVSKILTEYGEPLETRDLVPLVKEQGVEIGGKDDVATLSARLSNSPEHFKRHKGSGWWFADRALPGGLTEFEEAEGQLVEAQPSASEQDSKEGGESDSAALV